MPVTRSQNALSKRLPLMDSGRVEASRNESSNRMAVDRKTAFRTVAEGASRVFEAIVSLWADEGETPAASFSRCRAATADDHTTATMAAQSDRAMSSSIRLARNSLCIVMRGSYRRKWHR